MTTTARGEAGGRSRTALGRLARLGFADPERAQSLLADPALAGLVDPLEDVFEDGLPARLADVADPDQALLGLVRLLEALRAQDAARLRAGRDGPSPAATGRLLAALVGGGAAERRVRDRLLAVLGASTALVDHLARHPEHWLAVAEDAERPPGSRPSPSGLRADLLSAVGADPDAADPVAAEGGAAGHDALRVAYRRRLVGLAARDLAAADASVEVAAVAEELADLAAAALEAALAVARAELPQDAAPCRLAVIGLGKCGGRELNYVSDVDVVYVAEPVDDSEGDAGTDGGTGEAAALETATRLASAMARACGAVTAEGALWPVDANLRPEGKNGPLVRTLASHLAYYERWASTWEFQALLKARPVAGDRALGEAYVDAVGPLVWHAAEREGFVADVQAMRRRVEEHVPVREADRQLKLGRGGLRDVEFAVQLLQLVHGRADERLRTGQTLAGLEALSAYGYVGRDDAGRLDAAYRFLRVLEHRVQLHRLRRTHVLPTGGHDLRRLARTLGLRGDRGDLAEQLERTWRTHQREVRRLHEKLFYRPLLAAAAQLSADEARLSPEAARDRLVALGYRDPAGAMRHLEALSSGLSRRAAIQRTLLPVMLGWFANGADPDAGLLAFRRVSDNLGTTHWYLKLLRDSGAAAERLAHVLASSRYAASLLERAPEAVAMLDDDADLAPRSRTTLLAEVGSAAARHDDPRAGALAVRAVRRRELVRTAVAELVGLRGLTGAQEALSDAADAALQGALALATAVVERQRGGPLPTRLVVVGMGRLGGRELAYASDADVLFVADPVAGASEEDASRAALAVVGELRRLLQEPGPEPGLEVDAGLRPEGRQGPLVRSLASYASYYARWSARWEAQALVRARPVAGDEGLAERFTALIDPLRWPEGGLPEDDVRELRRIKARVEAERLPRGADPRRHLKLGPGAVADVEWTAQLLQLRHAARVEGLRTTSTTRALRAAGDAGLLAREHTDVLLEAWDTVSRVRHAVVLWSGKAVDQLPTGVRDLDGVARILGYPPQSAGALEEDHRRTTRRARTVVEEVFYG